MAVHSDNPDKPTLLLRLFTGEDWDHRVRIRFMNSVMDSDRGVRTEMRVGIPFG